MDPLNLTPGPQFKNFCIFWDGINWEQHNIFTFCKKQNVDKVIGNQKSLDDIMNMDQIRPLIPGSPKMDPKLWKFEIRNQIKWKLSNISTCCKWQKCRKYLKERETIGEDPTNPAPDPKFSNMSPKARWALFSKLK